MPSYTPPFAPRVRGDYPEIQLDEDRKVLPALVEMSCFRCGARDSIPCDSGRYRQRVARWALGHVDCPEGKITA